MPSGSQHQGRWQRALFAAGCLLLASANWPLLTFINRAGPPILGLPPFVFAMFVLNLLVAALLAIAYRILD